MEKRIAIVGAGVSGLLACKYCLQKGFNPIVFESDFRIGGIWAHTIESTRIQNIKQVYQFSDFPWDPSVTDVHPTHYQVIEYMESYAKHFGLLDCFRFNSTVTGIDYVGESFTEMESWQLWSGTGKPFGSKGKWHLRVKDGVTSELKDFEVEFVILCTGQFSGYPNIPYFPEDEGPEVFNGKVMHSMEFSAQDGKGISNYVKGKRVAVIGSHKSAVDIAAECAKINGTVKPCTMVQRSAHWFVPTGYFPALLLGFLFMNRFAELMIHKPGETFLHSLLATLLLPLKWAASKIMEGYVRWKLPLKKYGTLPKLSFGEDLSACQIAKLPETFYDKVKEGSIIIKNSKSFKFCKEGLIIEGENKPLAQDIVILATGFNGEEKLKSIFSSSAFRDLLNATSPVLLYRQILHPRIPQLAIVGYNESFTALGSSELKSLWLSNFLDGKFELPCIRDMEKEAGSWVHHIQKNTGQYCKRACIANTNIWYNDQLCKDMGYNPKRKNSFLAELFVPYEPMDYATLTKGKN